MKYFTYLMIVFSIASCGQDSNLILTQNYFDSAKTKIKSEGKIDKVTQMKEGNWKFYNTKGELIQEGEYENDQETGTWKYHYLSSQGELVNGKKEGIWKGFHDDGSISSTTNYVNDKQEGESKAFYKNGRLSTVSFYKNGKLNGPHIIFSSKNADTTTYMTYVDDKKNGLFKKYNNGKPYVVGHWKSEIGFVGKVSHYRNETLIKIEYRDNDGKIITTEYPSKSSF